ncbi:MAG: winged helix-turn-helix domain-containing protein, partial [Phycisphaerales bacterium]|nr:winged helix-turn-helix domain-containing protein [Phycisphaerales bacterium]
MTLRHSPNQPPSEPDPAPLAQAAGKRPPVLEVTDPEQWKICSTPIRLEIIDSLRALAPCTIRQIAADLGRPAPTLYKHIETLEKAGFVTRPGFRKSGRHVEQLVDLAADNFRIDFQRNGGAEHEALVATARSFMNAGYSAISDAAAAGALKVTPEALNVLLAYGLGRLTPDDFREIRALLGKMR